MKGKRMDNSLNSYLDKVDKYLRPMSASERADIINEIKSEMIELEIRGELSAEQIIIRLGGPKELAGAYLEEAISKGDGFSFKRLCAVVAFYSFAGAGSLFVLPVISVLGVGLMFCGMVAPVAGFIKALAYLMGTDIPWVNFQFGEYTLHPYPSFFFSVVLGILLFAAGMGLWKLTIKFVRTISRGKFQKRRIK